MLLTIGMAALAACGVLLILLTLKEAFLPAPERACHVIYLRSGRVDPVAQAQTCLWRRRMGAMNGRLLFADCGLTAAQQEAVAVLLRGVSEASLCSLAQLAEYFGNGEEEFGAGADRRNHRGGGVREP